MFDPADVELGDSVRAMLSAVEELSPSRVVIDSLSEFLLYLAPEFRREFRVTVFRILSHLAKRDVTVLVTMGIEDRFTELRFSDAEVSFLTDGIIATRYVEMDGELTKVISVVKLRGCSHSSALRAFRITDSGIEIESTNRELPTAGLPIASRHPSSVPPQRNACKSGALDCST